MEPIDETFPFTDEQLADYINDLEDHPSTHIAAEDAVELAHEVLRSRAALRQIANGAHMPRWERNDHGMPVPVCEPGCAVCIAQRTLANPSAG